jgi:hypothetical protein
MSNNLIKEVLPQVKAFRRTTKRFGKLWNELKVEIDGRVKFQMDIADALEDSDDIEEEGARTECVGLSRYPQLDSLILDRLEHISKWMAESGEKLASLVKKAREAKAG